jgi:hypothetical protein
MPPEDKVRELSAGILAQIMFWSRADGSDRAVAAVNAYMTNLCPQAPLNAETEL